MVFILDACSFHYAHIWSKYGISICWRHLFTSKETSYPIFFRKWPILHHACATCSELQSHISTMIFTVRSFYSNTVCKRFLLSSSWYAKTGRDRIVKYRLYIAKKICMWYVCTLRIYLNNLFDDKFQLALTGAGTISFYCFSLLYLYKMVAQNMFGKFVKKVLSEKKHRIWRLFRCK